MSIRFQRSSFPVFSQRHNTHTCHACTISQSIIKRTMVRLLAAALSRKNPFFHSVKTDSRIQILVLPNRKQIIVLLPAQLFLPMPHPEHVPFWEGPAPEEGTPWGSGEPSRRKGSANRSPDGRGLRTLARGAPPATSTMSFVSRRHKSRGDPRSRIGLQCGHFIVREASQRPVVGCFAGGQVRAAFEASACRQRKIFASSLRCQGPLHISRLIRDALKN